MFFIQWYSLSTDINLYSKATAHTLMVHKIQNYINGNIMQIEKLFVGPFLISRYGLC